MHHCLFKSPGSDLSGLSLFELTKTKLQAKKFIDILSCVHSRFKIDLEIESRQTA